MRRIRTSAFLPAFALFPLMGRSLPEPGGALPRARGRLDDGAVLGCLEGVRLSAQRSRRFEILLQRAVAVVTEGTKLTSAGCHDF